MLHDSPLFSPHFSMNPTDPLLPPGLDPANVDYRTSFYSYNPNEVKHRKRTSRAQLKVLEEVFSKDTKPNGALRKKLAKQLDMTPRGVQVWFQNRRAKEKAQSKKLPIEQTASAPPAIITQLSPDNGTGSLDDFSDDSTIESYRPNVFLPPPTLPPTATSFFNPWNPSPSVSPIDSVPFFLPNTATAQHTHLDLPPDSHHFLNLRRGSLPVFSYPNHNDLSAHTNPLPADLVRRRSSVDTSLYRLAAHPYAPIAIAKNNAIYGSTIARSPSQLRLAAAQLHHSRAASFGGGNGQAAARPNLAHRASLPHVLTTALGSRGRYSTANVSSSPSPSPLGVMYDSRVFSARHHPPSLPHASASSSPIPGPLPSPDFSFGTAAAPTDESPSPLFSTPVYSLSDVEEDGCSTATTRTSFLSLPRFGSMSSAAGSESGSIFSVDSGAVSYDLDARRGSCASGHMLEMMNELNVNANNGHFDGEVAPPSASLPVSASSELAFALQGAEESGTATNGNSSQAAGVSQDQEGTSASSSLSSSPSVNAYFLATTPTTSTADKFNPGYDASGGTTAPFSTFGGADYHHHHHPSDPYVESMMMAAVPVPPPPSTVHGSFVHVV